MTPRRRFFREAGALAALGLLGACVYSPRSERVVRRDDDDDDDDNNNNRGGWRPWWRRRPPRRSRY